MASNQVIASLAVKISAQQTEFASALKQSQAQLNSFTNSVKAVGSSLGITFGAVGVFQGLKYGVSVMADFEKRMSEVMAITQETGEGFKQLQDNALELGRTTLYTAEQVAELEVAYGRLGFTKDEILATTKATIDLATATGEDLAKSADVVGSTLRAFNLNANQSQRITDVMASSFNKTALGLNNFAEAMKYVAPVAAAANVSIEQTTALLGVLADNGIRGSTAGTALRKIFTDLSKDGRPFADRLQELSEKGLTFSGAFDEVGRTAQSALLVLSKNKERADELAESFKHVTGETAEMARVMSDNLSGDVTKLSGAFNGLILAASGTTSPIRVFVQDITAMLNIIADPKSILSIESFADALRHIPKVIPGANELGLIGEGIKSAGELSSKEIKELNLELALLKVNLEQPITEDARQGIFKRISEITNRLGLFKGQSVEDILPQVTQSDPKVEQFIETIGTLKVKLKDLQDQFEKIPSGDVLGLERTRIKIENLEAEIYKIQNLSSTFDRRQNSDTPITSSVVNINSAEGKVFSAQDFSKEIKVAALDIDGSLEKVNSAFEKNKASVENWGESMRAVTKDVEVNVGGAVASLVTDISVALGKGIGSGFGDDFLQAVAKFGKQLGSLLIGVGAAGLAFEVSAESGNYVALIAAGAALVALSSAAAESLSSASTVSSRASSASSSAVGVANSKNVNTGSFNEIRLDGQFTVKGTDLIYIFNRQEQLNSRTGG